jgi:hypothetical protein
LAAFFGRGVEIRRARGGVEALGSGEFSAEAVVSSLILLTRIKPAGTSGVENIQARESPKRSSANCSKIAVSERWRESLGRIRNS